MSTDPRSHSSATSFAQPSRYRQVGLLILVAALAIGTALCTLWVDRSIKHNLSDHLDFEAEHIDTTLGQQVRAYSQVLLGGAALFAATPHVERADWRRYVDALRIEERYPGIKSLAYLPLVPREQLGEFVEQVRREPVPAEMSDPARLTRFTVRSVSAATASELPESAPILYIEPLSPENEVAIGADPLQDPLRREAMWRAVSTRDIAISPIVPMAVTDPTDERVGFIVYAPIFRADALVGWLSAAFHAEEFVGGALGGAGPDVDFEISDTERLLYSTAGASAAGAPVPLGARSGMSVASAPAAPDRPWTIRYVARAELASTPERLAPAATAVAGILVILLIWALSTSGARWHRRAVRSQTREQLVRHLATHDPLTQLPNRALFQERLDAAIPGHPFALAYVDIDGFKPVNDQHGHRVGDALLIAIADRLRAHVESSATVARIGGDEFAILYAHADDAAALGDALVAELCAAYRITVDETTFDVDIGASIGIARYPVDAPTGDELVHVADEAMLVAKRSGRGRSVLATDRPHSAQK